VVGVCVGEYRALSRAERATGREGIERRHGRGSERLQCPADLLEARNLETIEVVLADRGLQVIYPVLDRYPRLQRVRQTGPRHRVAGTGARDVVKNCVRRSTGVGAAVCRRIEGVPSEHLIERYFEPVVEQRKLLLACEHLRQQKSPVDAADTGDRT